MQNRTRCMYELYDKKSSLYCMYNIRDLFLQTLRHIITIPAVENVPYLLNSFVKFPTQK